jgi:hypothetical protein
MLAIPFLLALTVAPESLQRGQIIKQFEAYSISESFKWNRPWATSIPCLDPMTGKFPTPWSLELPLFHGVSSLAVQALPQFPAVMPLLIFLLLTFLSYGLAQALVGQRLGAIVAVSVLCSPALLRYSVQFIPDVLALAGLVAGAWMSVKGSRFLSRFWWCLGVTAKPLVFPAAFLMGIVREGTLKNAVWLGGALLAPFLLWVWVLYLYEIPGSQMFHRGGGDGVVGDYLGTRFELLASWTYYSKFIQWVFVKGTGIPSLFIGAVLFTLPNLRAYFRRNASLFGPWVLGGMSLWIFVRQGSVIHDYYSLGLIYALSLWVWSVWARVPLPSERIRTAGFLFGILWGAYSLMSLQSQTLDEGRAKETGRPIFCGQELRPQTKGAEY